MPGENGKVEDETTDLIGDENVVGNEADEEPDVESEEEVDENEPKEKEDEAFDAKTKFDELSSKMDELTNVLTTLANNQVKPNEQPAPKAEDDFGFKVEDGVDYGEVNPNELAKKVYAKVMGDVQDEIKSTNEGNKVRTKFYGKYPEFKGLEVLAGAVGSQVEREMPNRSMDEQLNEVANRMHSIIDNAHTTYSKKVGTGGTPSQRRTPKEKVSKTEKEKLDVLGLA